MPVVDIPIEIEPGDPGQALPYVRADVGGRTVRVLLDSGSGRTTVTPPDDAILHTREPEGSGVFGGQGERRVWRTSIRLGDVDLGTIEVDTHKPGEGRDHIGQDVLSLFRCEYRFAEHTLRLDEHAAPAETFPIFLGDGRHVYLDVAWSSGGAASAIFDTGASVTVADASFVRTHSALFTPAGESQGTDGSGAVLETPMATMNGPRILGQTFTASTVAVVDLSAVNQTIQCPMDLILGWPLLQQANWLVDHPKRSAGLTA